MKRAIQTVAESVTRFGAPVFIRHQIVHNAWVMAGLARGAVFVQESNSSKSPTAGAAAADPIPEPTSVALIGTGLLGLGLGLLRRLRHPI